MLTPAEMEAFRRDGFHLARGVWTPEEVRQALDKADELHARGAIAGCFSADPDSDDPLERYPRMMHPHRVDDLCLHFLRHPRMIAMLEELCGERFLGAQTMIYFKPPGARGQDLHQDNFYLQSQPRPCMAAWVALEPIDAGNGGMSVVPGSHDLPILEMRPADSSESFTPDAVTVPEGKTPILPEMEAGDVLFFNGNVIHGSLPNTSKDRWRRAFICHYLPEDHESYNHGYDPLVPLR